jgi:hypothetical protein
MMLPTQYHAQLIGMRDALMRAGWRISDGPGESWEVESIWSPSGFRVSILFHVTHERYDFSAVDAYAEGEPNRFAFTTLGRHWKRDFPAFLAALAAKRDQALATKKS